MNRRSNCCVGICACALLAVVGCSQKADQPGASGNPRLPAATPDRVRVADSSSPNPASTASGKPQRIKSTLLPNAFRLHDNVLSGGLPEGDAAFQELEDLGVKTIISVDGARPDVAMAKKHGMRYVHLPHGYDGISPEAARELAKAVRDLPGPIYVHCHHGQHRSPVAATVACVLIGYLQPADALGVLKAAGTSENYRGLYQAAEDARPVDGTVLDNLVADFPEVARLPPLAEAMVAIEATHDHLKAFQKADWKSLANHADLNAAHEALLLREHFTELLRTEEIGPKPAPFRELLSQSELGASQLEAALNDRPQSAEARSNDAHETSLKAVNEALDRVTKNCAACHITYRDRPLSKK